MLRPHIQPTGIALLALSGEADTSGRLGKSVAWLRRSIGNETTSASLAWAVLGLGTHGALPSEADAWLAARWAEAGDVDRGRFTYERALIAARLGERERALTLLRQAVGEGLPAIPYLYPEIEVDPDFDSLRSDPAFHRLLEPKG